MVAIVNARPDGNQMTPSEWLRITSSQLERP